MKAGNLGDGAAFSFFPTKVMTTFEGGMITLNDEEEDYIARSLRNQGKREWTLEDYIQTLVIVPV